MLNPGPYTTFDNISCGAECIVSGDQDLLVLRKNRSIAILTPREFWERLKSGPGKA